MFKHILIPTDGTDLSRKAVIYGMQLAKSVGARVTAITISEPYHVASMDAVLVAETPEEHEAQTARVAERALEQVRMAAEAAGVSAETLAERNAALMIGESELSSARFVETVSTLIVDRPRLEAIGEAARHLAHADAAAHIARIAARLAGVPAKRPDHR